MCGYSLIEDQPLYPRLYPHVKGLEINSDWGYKTPMPKDATEKFRLSSEEKAALRKTARLANIPLSVLIRLCLTSQHHVGTHPKTLRRAAARP